jgi:hypothetical protein
MARFLEIGDVPMRQSSGVRRGFRSVRWFTGFRAKNDTSIYAVKLMLRRLIRTSRFVNEVCVEYGNCLSQQVG